MMMASSMKLQGLVQRPEYNGMVVEKMKKSIEIDAVAKAFKIPVRETAPYNMTHGGGLWVKLQNIEGVRSELAIADECSEAKEEYFATIPKPLTKKHFALEARLLNQHKKAFWQEEEEGDSYMKLQGLVQRPEYNEMVVEKMKKKSIKIDAMDMVFKIPVRETAPYTVTDGSGFWVKLENVKFIEGETVISDQCNKAMRKYLESEPKSTAEGQDRVDLVPALMDQYLRIFSGMEIGNATSSNDALASD